jgi:hypothetical protein
MQICVWHRRFIGDAASVFWVIQKNFFLDNPEGTCSKFFWIFGRFCTNLQALMYHKAESNHWSNVCVACDAQKGGNNNNIYICDSSIHPRRKIVTQYTILSKNCAPYMIFVSNCPYTHHQKAILYGVFCNKARLPLNEWLAHRICLTTHNIHNTQTSMPPAGFEADPRLRPRGHWDRHIILNFE